MSVTDAERRLVYDRLEATLGEEAAALVMRMLPWQTHDELMTRTDAAALTTSLRGEMAELRGELRGEMAELRGELRGEMAELRAEFNLRFATMQRWMVAVIAANTAALVVALVT
jgi:hypothetical protein